jgi:hypothetical protein
MTPNEFDGVQWSGLRIIADVRPLDGDTTQLAQADVDAIQAAIMDALPPGDIAVSISVRRLVG